MEGVGLAAVDSGVWEDEAAAAAAAVGEGLAGDSVAEGCTCKRSSLVAGCDEGATLYIRVRVLSIPPM